MTSPHVECPFILLYNYIMEIVFYRKESGRSPIEDFIAKLNDQERIEIAAHLDALRQLGLEARRPLVDYLEDGIYELRIRVVKKQIRVLYFFVQRDKIVVTDGFVKKSKNPYPKEIKKAKRFREDFTRRFYKEV
jgi:phage-related protein